MSNFISDYTLPYSRKTQLGVVTQLGKDTDIGGGRENQDDVFMWMEKSLNLTVIGVFDGHGREVGRVAASAAKRCIVSLLETDYMSLLLSPVDFLVKAHREAHSYIKQAFISEFQRMGNQVMESDEGYLLKRKLATDNWSCVHGGSACTLIALVDSRLYVSNVGDSTAILCSHLPILGHTLIREERDAAFANDFKKSFGSCCEEHLTTLVLTAEHSPECSVEFERLRNFRQRLGDPSQPSLFVVYDSSLHDKTQCAAVFDASSHSLVPSQRGSYYKNVRKEWASLVSTPPYAQFQDALAFTRSLGDFHLHTYGVTHLPKVSSVNISEVLLKLRQSLGCNAEDEENGDLSAVLCLVVGTDGIWDNWLYEDLGKFVMDNSCLRAVWSSAEGAQRVASSLIHRNAIYSKKNFGSQADNATGIVMYISNTMNFPSQHQLNS